MFPLVALGLLLARAENLSCKWKIKFSWVVGVKDPGKKTFVKTHTQRFLVCLRLNVEAQKPVVTFTKHTNTQSRLIRI